MLKTVSMYRFLSVYVHCFVLLRLYNSVALLYALINLFFGIYKVLNLPFMKCFDNYVPFNFNLSSKGMEIFV